MIAPRPIVLNPRSRDRRGTILVGLLVGLMLLASALVAVAISGRREQDLTMRRMEAMRAAYAEEAAAQIAVRELVNQQDDDGDSRIGTVASGSLTPGITIGSSTAAALADGVGGWNWRIQPQGANGLSTKGSRITVSTTNYVPGLFVEGWALGSAPSSVDTITWSATPNSVCIAPNVDTAMPWTVAFAQRYRGLITIPAAGSWTFSTTSNDGSKLFINGQLVVDNDGIHASQTRSGSITLPAGVAIFDLKYFNHSSTATLSASWQGPTVATTTVIPPSAFTCDPATAVHPVATTGSMSLAGATLNGYLSRSGSYGGVNITSAFGVQTNLTSAGALNVSVGTLSANALCGQGGTPSTAITTSSGGSISGTITAATVDVSPIWQVAPLASLATSGALNVTATTTISADTRYSSITVNTPNARLIISGNRVIQVDGNVTIGSNCTVEIAANSSLCLYMTAGTLSLANTSQVNANTADPTRLRVFFTAAGLSMTMTGSAIFHGYVFAPSGGLTITGGTTPAPTFFGVYHGQTLSTTSTALFRADASFGSTSANTILLSEWRQTQ